MREHYQKRDRLRLIVDYRKKFLDSFVRGGDEEAKQATSPPALSPSDAERETIGCMNAATGNHHCPRSAEPAAGKSRVRALPTQRAEAGVLEELTAKRARMLEREIGELEREAERLAGEIEELGGGEASRIV